jgi:hypothetical protein
MHLSYRNVLDLLRLRGGYSGRWLRPAGALRARQGSPRRLLVAPSILRRQDVYAIVVVRRPAESIESVLAIWEGIPSVASYSDVDAAVDYYVKRLRSRATVREHASHCLFVRAEDVVQETSRALAEVEQSSGSSNASRSNTRSPHTRAIRVRGTTQQRSGPGGSFAPQSAAREASRHDDACGCDPFLRGMLRRAQLTRRRARRRVLVDHT